MISVSDLTFEQVLTLLNAIAAFNNSTIPADLESATDEALLRLAAIQEQFELLAGANAAIAEIQARSEYIVLNQIIQTLPQS